jgi:hypothetical protein
VSLRHHQDDGAVLNSALLGLAGSEAVLFSLDQLIQFFDQLGKLIVVFFLLDAMHKPVHALAFFGSHTEKPSRELGNCQSRECAAGYLRLRAHYLHKGKYSKQLQTIA